MASLEDTIKEISAHLNSTDDYTQLTDWYFSLCGAKAFYGLELARLKARRGERIGSIKNRLITERGKVSQAEAENEYYTTQEGQFDAFYSELLRHIAPLIEAVKIKREALK